MFVLCQSILIVLIAAAVGAFLARVFMMTSKPQSAVSDELTALRDERDELKRQVAAGAEAALQDAIVTRKAAALEAELAEVRLRADELAAVNAKLREAGSEADELAALKWRNKYLEARVLFFEGRDEGSVVEVPPMPEAMTTTRLVRSVDDDAENLLARLDAEEERDPVDTQEPDLVSHIADLPPTASPKARRKNVAAPALSNANFTPSPLADLSPEVLEEMVSQAGTGVAPPRSRRRANPDDLLLIDGVGPKNKAWLNEQGIYYFYQIATMTTENVAWLANNLPTFGSRVYRENWVAQCTRLARSNA